MSVMVVLGRHVSAEGTNVQTVDARHATNYEYRRNVLRIQTRSSRASSGSAAEIARLQRTSTGGFGERCEPLAVHIQ